MFKIKICGITTPEDALLAAEAGADAIGLNFFEQSPRYVTPELARSITEAVRERMGPRAPRLIGVFVNSSQEEMLEVAAVAEIDGFQLHGDEPPEQIAELNWMNTISLGWLERWLLPAPRVLIIRALRCRGTNLLEVSDYLRRCVELRDELKKSSVPAFATYPVLPQAVLLDSYAPGAYGGTGLVVDWNIVRKERDLLMGLPVILAGGLTPENVAEAIATARPDAVDVASGVESSPGRKDPDKVRRFIAEAQRAFAELPRG